MSEDKIDRIEHDKGMMYMSSCNRRMFFAVMIVCITFILVIVSNTIRQEKWINAFLKVVTPVTAEVDNGTQQSGNP